MANQLMAEEIELYLMRALRDVRDLDEIKVFVRGALPPGTVPLNLFPYCEILVESEGNQGELTGGYFEDLYAGVIRFNLLLVGKRSGDWLGDLGNRLREVPSYRLLRGYMMAARDELSQDTHRDLGGLVVGEEAVTAFRLTEPRTYGLGLGERANNYENFGSLPFEVETDRRAV